MKRVYLFLLVFVLCAGKAYSDKTIEFNMAVGDRVRLFPYKELGIDPKCVDYTCNPATSLSGDYSVYNLSNDGSYALYDATGTPGDPFAIQTNQYNSFAHTHNGTYLQHHYYTYDVTALKAGTFRFSQKIQYNNGSNNHPRPTITYIIHVYDLTSISLGTDELFLHIGDTLTFSPIIYHPIATKTINWASSNPTVAVVDSFGMLTTTGLGTTIITCTAHNGVSAQCVVNVRPVLMNSIELNETDVAVNVGERLQLEATIAPENTTDKSLTWSSSNENVAFVNEAGKVFAVGKGFCQIKAVANDGSGKHFSCFIEVSNSVRGDMDGDGKVTMTDAVKVIDIILEK